MTHRTKLSATALFSALIFAAIVAAGCSGGGGGSRMLPLDSNRGTLSRDARHARVTASLYLRIPPRMHRRQRMHPLYISPNTQSLTVLVQRVTASPWPSPLPLQLLVAATPSPCAAAAGGSLICSFQVQAFVGQDVFTFNTYASKSPAPTDTPLSTLTSGITTVSSSPSPLAFTLEGVVHDVLLGVPDPKSTYDPVSIATEVVPIGTATAFPLAVTPRDASGASILTDTFSTPITLTVSPALSGVTLKLQPQCPNDSSSPLKLVLTCASDLSQVTVEYHGTVAPAGDGTYYDSATIAAAPQAAVASLRRAHATIPAPATVDLASSVQEIKVFTPPAYSSVSLTNLTHNEVNGRLVLGAAVYGYTNSGELIAIDPANPTANPVTAALSFAPGAMYADPSGNIWTSDSATSSLQCLKSVGATPVAIPIGDSNGLIYYVNALTQDTAGHLWLIGQDESAMPAVGFFKNKGCVSSGTQNLQFVFGTSYTDYPFTISLVPPLAGSPGVAATTNNYSTQTGSIYQLYTSMAPPPSGSPSPSPSPVTTAPPGVQTNGLASDPALNLYVALAGTFSGLSPGIVEHGGANAVVNTQPSSIPYVLDEFSGTHATAQELAATDSSYAGAIFIAPVASTTEPLLFALDSVNYCSGVTFDAAGGPWFLCQRGDQSGWLYHPLVTSTWSVLTTTFLTYSVPANQVLGVVERSGVDSSPFTITHNSDSSIIGVRSPWAKFPHSLPIVLKGLGTDTLTIQDRFGRTQTVGITVAQSIGLGLRRGPKMVRASGAHGPPLRLRVR